MTELSTYPTMSTISPTTIEPDHDDKSALLFSAIMNLILFVLVMYLSIAFFKRSWRQGWFQRRQRRNSENIPLLDISGLSQTQTQGQRQQGQHQPAEQRSQEHENRQQREQEGQRNEGDEQLCHERDDSANMVTIDLQSESSSDHEVSPRNWFQKLFQKK
jgi:hypothetical protein